MNIDLNDYVAGGYFVVKYSDHGFWKSDLLPERVISLSGCFGEKLDIVWGWEPEKAKQQAIDFGIAADKIELFRQWCFGKGPSALYKLDFAQEFVTQFLDDANDYLIIGIALPKALVKDFLLENKQQTFYTEEQVYKDSELVSVSYVLTVGSPLPIGGNICGFEVLSFYTYDFGHSWLCSNIEKQMKELFGIHPNQYGLIDSDQDAMKVYEWIAEDEQQGGRAEPEPYHPWLIVQYPVS